MVKFKPMQMVDMLFGGFVLLTYPNHALPLMAVLMACIFGLCIFHRPVFRFLLPVLAIFLDHLMAHVSRGLMRSGLETDYFFFIFAALIWAAAPHGLAMASQSGRRITLIAMTAFSATLSGFFLFWLFDRLLPRLERMANLPAIRLTSPGHLAAVGIGSVLLAFGGICLVRLFTRKKPARLLAYTYGYLACKKDLIRLVRKWTC